eukprot:m51a1_g5660 hypothetical protein (641) ;mRNA; r:898354-901138
MARGSHAAALLCVVAVAALFQVALAGAPKEESLLLYMRNDHPRDVILHEGTTFVEVELEVAPHMLSLADSAVIVEKWVEPVPLTTVDAKAYENITVTLQQLEKDSDVVPNATANTTALAALTELTEADYTTGTWRNLTELYSFNFTDKGTKRFFAKSIGGVSGFSHGKHHRLHITTTLGPTVVLKVGVVCINNYGLAQAWLGLAVLIVTYSIISFEFAERALMGLSAMFVTLLFLLIAHKEYPLETVATWLDQSTFVLLFGMMIIVKIFGDTGFFEWIAVQSIRLSRGSVRILFVLICSLTAFLSAFLDNVTTVLLSAPITIKVCEVLEVSPVPFLIGQALLSNIGGTATLVGDPPNIIIGSMLKDVVTFNDFIANLMPCVIIVAVIIEVFLLWWYRHSVAGRRQLNLEELQKEGKIKEKVKFIKCSIILAIVLLAFFLSSLINAEPAWIALAGATALMLLTYPKHIETPLTGVEWNTLVFFGALFVLVRGMEKLGLIRLITDLVAYIISSCPPERHEIVAITVILWVSALVSAVISSIPTTTTLIPVIVDLADDPNLKLALRPLIWALAFGACFGGNGTLIGAAANVVVAGIVRSKGYFVTFANFTKVGFPVMILSTIIANIYIIIVYPVAGLGVGSYD